ncbi:MAG: DUF1599 domain-containing protein [Bacteroidota bacterium]
MKQTQQQYEAVISRCKGLFLKKAQDYGTSWRILRMPSITDQIYIKAERIRSIQESGENKVGDSIEGEFIGIINYCVIALILWSFQEKEEEEIAAQLSNLHALEALYDEQVALAYETMEKKNHDYGEAWRKMRISSITDLILMKIFRLKKIEDNKGQLLVSEGPDANYIDMLNYAVFSLIKMDL